ncbi:MAG: HEAT repeat domain-containing protein [Woeseiaceae bacterium]|nr:HEAT repeat domain-containing protein [Woeseiaceae bacterium]
MSTRGLSHHCGRGAFAGLALALCAAAFAAPTLRDIVREQLRGQSYMLIETEGQPPRLLLFPRAGAEPMPLEHLRLLVELGDPDPDVRLEAVLELSDTDFPDTPAWLAAALNDPSAEVREAAEAVLDDLGDAGDD